MRPRVCLPALAVAAVFCLPSTAQARKFFLITSGETVTHVEELPADVKQVLQEKMGMPTDVAVGYSYSYFGIFWIDFWTWGGKHVLFRGNQTWEVPPSVLAEMLGKREKDLSVPKLYRFPPGVIGLVLIVGICLPVYILRRSRE